MTTKNKSTLLLIIGILLIAANLRGPITIVAPLINLIQDSLGLSSTEVGLLTTLPLLAFALISPFSSVLAKKYSFETTLLVALLTITFGIGIRSLGATAINLYIGTCILGCGIAIGNVTLPSLLKRDFPEKTTTITALYVLTMGVGAGVSSWIAIPVSNLNINDLSGWPLSMASIIILPLVSILVWLPQMRHRRLPTNTSTDLSELSELSANRNVWQSALGWQVTLFLGLNAYVTYTIVSWLPEILIDSGYTQAHASFIHGVLQLSTAVPGLILLPFIGKLKNQSSISFLVSIVAMVSVCGLLFFPSLSILWAILFGCGAGSGLILALSFIGLRTQNSHQASVLSGMSQGIGYLLAATGPALIGALYEQSNSWSSPLIVCIVSCALCAILGFFAGRDLTIPIKKNQEHFSSP